MNTGGESGSDGTYEALGNTMGITKAVNVRYLSTKTYTHSQGLSCSFRQWRAQSHCRHIHGYALEIEIVFGCLELDERGWVVDFGGLKPLKAWIERHFDHTTLIAKDDPKLDVFKQLHKEDLIDLVIVDCVGVEAFSELIYNIATTLLYKDCFDHNQDGSHETGTRCWVERVAVREHAGNSAVTVYPYVHDEAKADSKRHANSDGSDGQARSADGVSPDYSLAGLLDPRDVQGSF